MAAVTERVCINLHARFGIHMNDMRASTLFDMGLISIRSKLIEVLQLSRYVSRRRYISLLTLIKNSYAP